MRSTAEWIIAQTDASKVRTIQHALGLHEAVARALVNRGVDCEEKASRFLEPTLLDLHDPYLFVDMKPAVARIARAVRERESIVVYGDYDVDGLTASAVLVHFLRRLGGHVRAYIPDRLSEGYGLNRDAIATIAEQGCDLVITVDCGISSHDEVAFGYSLGLEFIITDHHEPPQVLPDAAAILNPKVPGSGYPFRDLAGVGVAFKIVEAVVRAASRKKDISSHLRDYLGLAALGTIADMVPLVGENRVIACIGIPEIRSGRNRGLAELSRVAGISHEDVGVREIAFSIAPRINAAGRMGNPSLALELLLSTDRKEAAVKADQMDAMNRDRRTVQQEILDDILSDLPPPDQFSNGMVITAGESWHPGVVGLVASKLVEMYYRPAIVLSREGECARGSARSIPGFDIFSALRECSDLLMEYGGHQQAAGLTVQWDDIPLLVEKLNEIVRDLLSTESLVRRIYVDGVLDSSELNIGLARQIERLEPFGESNPPPLFFVRGLSILEYRTVGAGGRHLKLVLGSMDSPVDAIAFSLGDLAEQIQSERVDCVDVVGELSVNDWNGRQRLQMIVCDMASADSTHQK